MVDPVSIHRIKDLASARRRLEHTRRQKGLPETLVIPESLVEKLADKLQDFREERQAALAAAKAEIEAEAGIVWAELRLLKDQIGAVRAAWRAFHAARIALGAALDAVLADLEPRARDRRVARPPSPPDVA